MNPPGLEQSYEEQAIDTVVSVINSAKEKVGVRQTLCQLAETRDVFLTAPKVNVGSLKSPLAITSEALIKNTIAKQWRLTDMYKYVLKYAGMSQDECAQYYYFEAIFSQPTVAYPIPQATASVFFRVENKQILPQELMGAPKLVFRVEGSYIDHDVREVLLPADWLLAVLQMKIKLFRRIEELRIF